MSLYLSIGNREPLNVLSEEVTEKRKDWNGNDRKQEETARHPEALAERGDTRDPLHKGHYGVESTWLEEAMKTPGLGDVINTERWARSTSVELGGPWRAGDDRWLEVEMFYGPLEILVQDSESRLEMKVLTWGPEGCPKNVQS